MIYLPENKNHIISQLPKLSSEEKEEVKRYFNSHANLENQVDWNKSNWGNLTFEYFIQNFINNPTKTAKKKAVKASGINGLTEGEDYLFVHEREYTLDGLSGKIEGYIPLSWEASQHIASKNVGSGKVTGKWCIAYQKEIRYWDEYNRDGYFIILVDYNDRGKIHEDESNEENLKDKIPEMDQFTWGKLAIHVLNNGEIDLYDRFDRKNFNSARLAIKEFNPKKFWKVENFPLLVPYLKKDTYTSGMNIPENVHELIQYKRQYNFFRLNFGTWYGRNKKFCAIQCIFERKSWVEGEDGIQSIDEVTEEDIMGTDSKGDFNTIGSAWLDVSQEEYSQVEMSPINPGMLLPGIYFEDNKDFYREIREVLSLYKIPTNQCLLLWYDTKSNLEDVYSGLPAFWSKYKKYPNSKFMISKEGREDRIKEEVRNYITLSNIDDFKYLLLLDQKKGLKDSSYLFDKDYLLKNIIIPLLSGGTTISKYMMRDISEYIDLDSFYSKNPFYPKFTLYTKDSNFLEKLLV